MNNNLKYFFQKIEKLKAENQLRQLKEFKQKKNYVNLSSNDYLGISHNKMFRDEFENFLKQTVNVYKWGSTSSRLLMGNYQRLGELEEFISGKYKHHKEALVLNSGYHANSGLIPALIGRNDLILSDKLNHASIIDGALLSRADFFRYNHLDYDHLEKILDKKQQEYKKILIISESVFSMDGDEANLARLVALKNKYPQTLLYIDEAHAVGVRGENGLGVCEETGLIADIEIIVGTFGKAFGSVGAFIVAERPLKEFFINFCRTLIYSTSLPPINTMFNSFIFRKIGEEILSRERTKLARIAFWFKKELSHAGFAIDTLNKSNIVPIIIGSNKKCLEISAFLEEKGFICPAIRPPTVPVNTSRLRVSLTSYVSKKDLTEFINLIKLFQDNS